MLTIVRVFRDCGICCKWKTPHKKKVKQHLVDRTTSQPTSNSCRKSGRIAARPQVSMAEEGGSSMFASKNGHDTSSNEEQSEEQSDSTSSERQQRIVLLKEGVHNLQNASSTIKGVKNLGNKQMATRTPDQV